MRWRCRRVRLRTLIIMVAVKLCISYFIYNRYLYETLNGETIVCNQGSQMGQALLDKTVTVQRVLNLLNIPYFACYGTLWAIIRRSKLYFPWSNSVQLCIRNEEVARVDEGLLIRYFNRYDLTCSYDSVQGLYLVRNVNDPAGTLNGTVQLVVFEQVYQEQIAKYQSRTSELRRIGLRHRILPSGSDALHQFPTWLVDPPLATKQASGVEVTIPRENFELQKYLYKDDWWIERKVCGS